MRIFKLFIPFIVLALLGAGCFDFNGAEKANDGGVWKSTDAGLNWLQAVALPTAKGVGTLAAVNVLDFEIDPSDHLALYIGTRSNGMFFSYDGGVSWMRPWEDEMKTGDVNAIAVDPINKCTIYAAKSTRLAKTTDCSRTFDTEIYSETRPKVTITDVAVDFYDSRIVWMGTSEGDVMKSLDGGMTWDTVYRAKSDIVKILIDNSDSRIVYAATKRRGMVKTEDGGENWVDLEDAFDDFSEGKKMVTLSQDAEGKVLIASTGYGILRSTDKGNTWEKIELLTAPKEVDIPAVAIDPNDTNRIYYATSATFYSTVDGGMNWQARSLTTSRTPTMIAVDPTDGDVIYITAASFD